MRILIVLSALLAFAAAWPHTEKQEKFQQDVLHNARMAYDGMSQNQPVNDEFIENEDEYGQGQLDDSGISQNQPIELVDQQDQYAEQEVYGLQRVFSLDMTDIYQHCPSSLKLNTYGSRRLCGKKTNGRGCNSVTIPTGGKTYSEVHGRVIAYQYGSPDAFNVGGYSIDGSYVDGISITYGRPRKHVWTLGAGAYSYNSHASTCPGTGHGKSQPGFVANHYFCTSGNFDRNKWESRLYDTPLWSTVIGDCERKVHDVPYFCTKLPEQTTKDLELRICTTEDLDNEDIQIESITLYVR